MLCYLIFEPKKVNSKYGDVFLIWKIKIWYIHETKNLKTVLSRSFQLNNVRKLISRKLLFSERFFGCYKNELFHKDNFQQT
jgi:hypothetical protein